MPPTVPFMWVWGNNTEVNDITPEGCFAANASGQNEENLYFCTQMKRYCTCFIRPTAAEESETGGCKSG